MVLSGVGATLREERLRRQFSLEHVSNVTRIQARYLEAIENDRPSDLPGVVFTRGFVRQYARFLDIPDEDLLSQIPKIDIGNVALPVAPPKAPKPFWTRTRVSGATRAAVAATVLSAGVGGWMYFDMTPIAKDATGAAWDATVVAFRHRREQIAAAQKLQTKPAATPQSVIQATAAPSNGIPQVQPEPVKQPEVSSVSAIQVLLTAKANAWVQVIADGKPAFTGLLHANDRREVSGNELVKVVTGNAGALEISLNGKALDPIGPEGQVRTVRLTAEGPLPDPKNPPSAPVADPL